MCYSDDEILREVIAEFPEFFGLKVFGGRFTINEDQSFFDHHGEMQLYVFTERGCAFSRGTPQELWEEITP